MMAVVAENWITAPKQVAADGEWWVVG